MFQLGARAAGPTLLGLVLYLAAAVPAQMFLLPRGAQAATLSVTSTADDGTSGTLRSKIDEANGGDRSNEIRFSVPSGSEVLLMLEGGTLPIEIKSDLTLEGVPNSVSVISIAGGTGTFLVKDNGGRLTLHEVSILVGGIQIEDGAELEINTDVEDRTWGDETNAVPFISGEGNFVKSGSKALTVFGAPPRKGTSTSLFTSSPNRESPTPARP